LTQPSGDQQPVASRLPSGHKMVSAQISALCKEEIFFASGF
jgi:hypothetical protein